MDRAEGALLVAERALKGTADIAQKLAEIREMANARPERGVDGVGIADIRISDDGYAVVHLSDGRSVDLGRLRGRDGVDGREGRDGRDGVAGRSITSATIGNDHVLRLTYTDGAEEMVGAVVGPAGNDGRDGVDGKDGRDGAAGPRGEAGPKGDRGDRGLAGKDGVDGKDGIDGSVFSFGESYKLSAEDMARLRVVEMVDESGAVRRMITLD